MDSTEEANVFEIFAFAARPKLTDLKLHLVQINGNNSKVHFSKRIVELPIDSIPENDFPIRVVYDSVYKLVFIYTKFGFVFAIEPTTGTCIMNEKYSDSPIYLVAPSLDQSTHFVLSRKGEIYQSSVNIEPFFSKCIEKGVDHYEPVGTFMNNIAMEQQASIYRNYFDKLKNSGRHLEALLLVAKSGKPFLRTFEYLSGIKDFPNINETSALLEYFAIVLENGKLNEVESLELVQLALSKKKLDIVRKWLASDQIFCTPQLGKVVIEADPELALKIFEKSASTSMIIHSLALLGRFEEFSNLLITSSEDIDFKSIYSSLSKTNKELIPHFLSVVIQGRKTCLNESLVLEILETDFSSLTAEVYELFVKNPDFLVYIDSEQINTRIAVKLVDVNMDLFCEFVSTCEENNLVLSKEDILPLLKASNMNILAFSFESNLDECIDLAEHTVGHEKSIKSTNLSQTDVKKFIFKLVEEDSSKYAKLCAKMGEFIKDEDFEEIKELLRVNVDEETFCDFLIARSQNMKSENGLADEILKSVIKLQDESRILDVCEKGEFSDPQSAFRAVSVNFTYIVVNIIF